MRQTVALVCLINSQAAESRKEYTHADDTDQTDLINKSFEDHPCATNFVFESKPLKAKNEYTHADDTDQTDQINKNCEDQFNPRHPCATNFVFDT